MKRAEHGLPVRGQSGSFNTADLAAKLSGVSLSSVARVIAALDAISQVQKVDADHLIEHYRNPLALPNEERSAQTSEAYKYVIARRDMVDQLVWDSLKTGADKVA